MGFCLKFDYRGNLGCRFVSFRWVGSFGNFEVGFFFGRRVWCFGMRRLGFGAFFNNFRLFRVFLRVVVESVKGVV